jgi:hypothetical protein
MRNLLLAGAALAALASLSPAQASIALSGSVGGAPTLPGVGRDNFDNLPVVPAGPATSPGAARSWGSVAFGTNSQVANGARSGVYAAPFLSGGNGAGFGAAGGDQGDGANTTPYLTVYAASTITLSFTSDQRYFGLLWGSIDGYNSIAFYDGATLVESFTGSDATASPNGNQGVNGTLYVEFLAETGSVFDRVVMSSSSAAFEFDNIAFAPFIPGGDPNAVPTPAALGLFGLGLAGLLAARRRRG